MELGVCQGCNDSGHRVSFPKDTLLAIYWYIEVNNAGKVTALEYTNQCLNSLQSSSNYYNN